MCICFSYFFWTWKGILRFSQWFYLRNKKSPINESRFNEYKQTTGSDLWFHSWKMFFMLFCHLISLIYFCIRQNECRAIFHVFYSFLSSLYFFFYYTHSLTFVFFHLSHRLDKFLSLIWKLLIHRQPKERKYNVMLRFWGVFYIILMLIMNQLLPPISHLTCDCAITEIYFCSNTIRRQKNNKTSSSFKGNSDSI